MKIHFMKCFGLYYKDFLCWHLLRISSVLVVNFRVLSNMGGGICLFIGKCHHHLFGLIHMKLQGGVIAVLNKLIKDCAEVMQGP